jgi:phosphatidylserine synthase
MVFDLADGYIARFTHSISILGAQLDRLADSLAALLVCAAAISMDRDVLTVVAAATVWVEFGVIDQLLASQFLRFGLWSPDHFYYVDERTWRMNWSAPAKLAGSLPILLLATGSSLAWAAFALALLLAIGKIQSMNQITKVAQHLPSARVPEPDWTDPQRERRMSCARGG